MYWRIPNPEPARCLLRTKPEHSGRGRSRRHAEGAGRETARTLAASRMRTVNFQQL